MTEPVPRTVTPAALLKIGNKTQDESVIAKNQPYFNSLLIHESVNWEVFLYRIGTVLIIAVPAFYAANESSKHREREKLIRKNFLELSVIDAFLVHLPEKERNEIKGKLSEKFFGVPEIHEKSDGVKNKDMMGFVEKIVKDLTKGH